MADNSSFPEHETYSYKLRSKLGDLFVKLAENQPYLPELEILRNEFQSENYIAWREGFGKVALGIAGTVKRDPQWINDYVAFLEAIVPVELIVKSPIISKSLDHPRLKDEKKRLELMSGLAANILSSMADHELEIDAAYAKAH
jgi:hypothetical protein